MTQQSVKRNNRRISLIISQIIIIAFLAFDIILFITKDSIVSRSLSAISFVLFLLLFIMFLRAIIKMKR